MNLQQYRLWHKQWLDATQPNPKTLVMGVVNVTPDSFFDGGKFAQHAQAINQAQKLIEEGADIIDIGGESSRPGAEFVTAEEEMNRILPIIESVRAHSDIIISVDTYKATVMKACVEVGANLINDITALPDESTQKWLATLNIPVCLMHMQDKPKTMQSAPHYPQGVISTIKGFFNSRIDECMANGIRSENIIVDPGFGFGKNSDHNLLMLQQINEFTEMPFPVLLGVSRKSTLGQVTGSDVKDRLAPSLAATIYSQLKGVNIFRTHDVAETVAAIKMLNAIVQQQEKEKA